MCWASSESSGEVWIFLVPTQVALTPRNAFACTKTVINTSDVEFPSEIRNMDFGDCAVTSLWSPKRMTSWSRVLPEKLTRPQLLKKFPEFYGNRRFITTFKSACHLSLSWARSILSVPPHPTPWRSILILSPLSTCRSSKWPPSLGCPHQNPVCTSSVPPFVPHALPILFF